MITLVRYSGSSYTEDDVSCSPTNISQTLWNSRDSFIWRLYNCWQIACPKTLICNFFFFSELGYSVTLCFYSFPWVSMLHFQSIINQQIIFLLLHPTTPLLHPSPSPTVKWHLSTHRACVILLHVEQPIQLIPRQAASHLASQQGRQPGWRHSSGVGHVVSANHCRTFLVATSAPHSYLTLWLWYASLFQLNPH